MTTFGFIIAALACLLSFVGGLLIVIAGFRDSTKWGLLNLFVPFAALVFTFTHWREAKQGFLMSLAGGVLAPVAVMMIIGGAVSSMGEQMQEQMALQMQQQMQEQMEAQQQAEGDWAMAGSEGTGSTAQDPTLDVAAAERTYTRPVVAPESVAVAELPDIGSPILDVPQIGSVKPSEAERHIGGRFKFIATDGSLFFGELLAVEGSHLRVKREMQGGSVEYGVDQTELAELRPIY